MHYLTIALAKGRISSQSILMLERAGFGYDELKSDSRKLIFTDENNKFKYILVKPADVPIYVEYGSADIGIVGKDVLLEENRDLYEPLDLRFGKCTMAVAGLKNTVFQYGRPYKIATKYPNITAKYFASVGTDVKIIKLSGSVELAPVIGLSDFIVDIVETGTTLRENNLSVYAKAVNSSARLIANKSRYQFKSEMIDSICRKLETKI
jgi:ATP phosphoribosyltransferase